ncbi:hypothetical protein LQ327_01520 [Actinomycetospora endophytica]|uniref:Carboxymuconolactone decarboxylase family protein n=1 Tax=Actinomycetospora endophytica TaxID=2291215 RepID=A0ABS8P1E4_9PSEU|nr:hypothetical protein [Actinomycetospora endophytica]MCD2192070.1 hypothetical protein [Actinomycetospora endophytica]
MGVDPIDDDESSPGAVPSLEAVLEAAARRDQRFREMVAVVAHGPGVLPPGVRESLIVGTAPPEGLAAFVAKVADGGLAVTDEDVTALLAAGYDEDAVFECVIAVAVAAGGARLRTVEKLLGASS